MFYADKLFYRKITIEPWQPWFAWRPVKIDNRYYWLKQIYRRRVIHHIDSNDWNKYEYGNLFTVLK